MNEGFYQAKFATRQYGSDAYDVKSLLPLLNLQPGFSYLEVGVGTGCFLHDFVTTAGVFAFAATAGLTKGRRFVNAKWFFSQFIPMLKIGPGATATADEPE